ncbi:serine/threonine-protein kinase [Nocardia spumae]|uniref:serine/threonine-protein kinase n=1 Tax=Nocardia spumae TaxID=2887190 RepID=UPI001D13287B|nr:serine/threonine-protein kinase [Nocardia spumae]
MLNNGDVFAGFTVERLLGQGGMGSVYLARHPRLPRLTALKLLNRELYTDAEIRARFEREADLCAQLDHPGIVAVYDRGVEDDQLWICMQYVDGIDAAGVNPLSLPLERAVQIIEGVGAALDYAHSNGVMHRDVKPANILLARAVGGKGERVFLTDFGIARLREDSTHLTQAGMFTATLAYASPEQMTGAALDHRSDQYSLACALYWLLTGTGPFDSEHPTEVIRGHLQLPVPPASARRAGLSPAMDAVISRAMAKRASERFGSCAEFVAAAREALTAPVAIPAVAGAAPTLIAPGRTLAPPRAIGPVPAGPAAGAPGMGGYAPIAPNLPGAARGMSSTGGFGGNTTVRPTPGSVKPVAAAPYSVGRPPPPPPGAGGYPPDAYGRPPAPKRSSPVGWIIGGVVVALLVIAAVVFMVMRGKANQEIADAMENIDASRRETAAMTKVFPALAVSGDGRGYNGGTCLASGGGQNIVAIAGTNLEVGNRSGSWDCSTQSGLPDYAVLKYPSSADAQAVVARLPSSRPGTGRTGTVSYTSHTNPPSSESIYTRWVVLSFGADTPRGQYLVVATSRAFSFMGSTDGMSEPEFTAWWQRMPLE